MWKVIGLGVDLVDSSFIWDICSKGQALVQEPTEQDNAFRYRLLNMYDTALQWVACTF